MIKRTQIPDRLRVILVKERSLGRFIKAINSLNSPEYLSRVVVSDGNPAETLLVSFPWRLSEDGYQYWRGIYSKYL